MGDGDLIVVNGSANASATGATGVSAIPQWHEAGVAVFSHDYLHTKGSRRHIRSEQGVLRLRACRTRSHHCVGRQPVVDIPFWREE
jgi:hypothetical protein